MKKLFKITLLAFTFLIGGLFIAGCQNEKAFAKDEDAVVFSAVAAANATGAPAQTATLDHQTADLEIPGGVEIGITDEDFDRVFKENLLQQIDELAAQIEAYIGDVKIKHQKSDREGYAKLSVYTTKVDGKEVSYKLYYNEVEVDEDEDGEVEIEIKGILVMGDKEIAINGEIVKEAGKLKTKLVHETDNLKVKIESQIRENKRVFKYQLEVDGKEVLEYEFSFYKKGKLVGLQTEFEMAGVEIEIKMELVKGGEQRQIRIKMEAEGIKLGAIEMEVEFEAVLTVTETKDEYVHKYQVKGKIEIKDHDDIEFDKTYELRHPKEVMPEPTPEPEQPTPTE